MPTPKLEGRFPVACFAPDLTDEKLAIYESLIHALPIGPLKHALSLCLRAVKIWWELPVSTRKNIARVLVVRNGKEQQVPVVPLEESWCQEGAALWEAVPWDYELESMQALFDKINPEEKQLRDAAFHLLWHAKELCQDREPLTQSVLK